VNSRLPQRILFLAAWTTFIFWTVRRFWRPIEDASLARIYEQSRFLGPVLTILIALVFSSQLDLPALSFWPGLAFWLVIAFPIAMWTMFFMLRSIQAVLGRLLP
jgi:hypothetical protein